MALHVGGLDFIPRTTRSHSAPLKIAPKHLVRIVSEHHPGWPPNQNHDRDLSLELVKGMQRGVLRSNVNHHEDPNSLERAIREGKDRH